MVAELHEQSAHGARQRLAVGVEHAGGQGRQQHTIESIVGPKTVRRWPCDGRAALTMVTYRFAALGATHRSNARVRASRRSVAVLAIASRPRSESSRAPGRSA